MATVAMVVVPVEPLGALPAAGAAEANATTGKVFDVGGAVYLADVVFVAPVAAPWVTGGGAGIEDGEGVVGVVTVEASWSVVDVGVG